MDTETLEQQLDTLKAAVSGGLIPDKDMSFAGSLLEQAVSPRGLSPKQWYWVGVLAGRATGPKETTLDSFAGVYALFQRAMQHLSFPKIWLTLPSGISIKLYVSGKRSRVPGVVNIVGGGIWLGRIYEDGRWEYGHGTPDHNAELRALLSRLASEPEVVAAEYGKLTGNCCFCSRKLSDERSTEVGYGPVCASRFQLPWG